MSDRLDQQSQLLQAQQQLLQQLNNEETAMKLLQHNLMQARMSPSLTTDQQLLQQQALIEHKLKQQVMLQLIVQNELIFQNKHPILKIHIHTFLNILYQ